MAFLINRNNEITEFLEFLKTRYKTSNNTTAIYRAIDELVTFFIPEFARLKKIEAEHIALKTQLSTVGTFFKNISQQP